MVPWLFILVFYIHERVVEHKMEERLEASMDHHTVTIADNKIKWEEKDREIWVDGKLFDIKTSHSENGSTTFTGLYDYEETEIKKLLQENLDRNSRNDDQILAQLITSFQQLFFEENSLSISTIVLPGTPNAEYNTRLPFPFTDISTPPPQVS